jgi:hypothetical protein
MRRMAYSEAPIVVVLDRLVLLLMVLVCLLQRVAMFGCCFGLIRQLRAEQSERGTERGAGIGLVFAILLLVISARQTLLDIVPRPGHAYVGQAVFGIHMPVWSVVIAVVLLAGFAIRLALFGAPRAAPDTGDSLMRRCARWLEVYVVFLCAINFIAVVLQCGLGECHTFGYRFLG